MVRSEPAGRAGRSEGPPARYTGVIKPSAEFGRRIYTEAWERGWHRAKKKVIIADGVEWIWNIADEHFPGAIHIVDIFRARQHLWDLARALYPNQESEQKRWVMRQPSKLDGGEIEKLVRSLRSIDAANPEPADKIRIEADYFERNSARMRYPDFRRHHLSIGSGVIEARCKTVIESRLNQSGMFWTVRGANAIIALRCYRLSNKFEDYRHDQCGGAHRALVVNARAVGRFRPDAERGAIY